MRMIYMDEAGTSTAERVSVVAAVVVRPDDHWLKLQTYLDEVKRKYIPEDLWDGWVFHAKKISAGSVPPFKDQKKGLWGPKNRWSLMKEVLSANKSVGFDVVFGYARVDEALAANTSKANEVHIRHLMAYTECLLGCEQLLRGYGELASLTIEDIPERKNALRSVKADLQNAKYVREGPLGQYSRFVPIRQIPEAANFVDKSECSLLQYADHCAFAMRGYLSGYRYFDELLDALFVSPISELPDHFLNREAGYLLCTKAFQLDHALERLGDVRSG